MSINHKAWTPSFAIEGDSILLLDVPCNGMNLDFRVQLPGQNLAHDYKILDSALIGMQKKCIELFTQFKTQDPTQIAIHYYDRNPTIVHLKTEKETLDCSNCHEIADPTEKIYQYVKTWGIPKNSTFEVDQSNLIDPTYTWHCIPSKPAPPPHKEEGKTPTSNKAASIIAPPDKDLVSLLDSLSGPYDKCKYSEFRGSTHYDAFKQLIVNPDDSDTKVQAIKNWLKTLQKIALDNYFTEKNTKPPNAEAERKKLASKAVIAGLAEDGMEINKLYHSLCNDQQSWLSWLLG